MYHLVSLFLFVMVLSVLISTVNRVFQVQHVSFQSYPPRGAGWLSTANQPDLLTLQQQWRSMVPEATRLLQAVETHPTMVRHPMAIPAYPEEMQRFAAQLAHDHNRYWINSWKHEGQWLSYPLVSMSAIVEGDTQSRCPTIVSLLQPLLPRIHMAGISRLVGHGTMHPHTDEIGVAFGNAAVHVCLLGRGELTVGESPPVEQLPGRLLMFDSTFVHSVHNSHDEDRLILYLTWLL